MKRHLVLAVLSAGLLTACASPVARRADTQEYRQQGLNAAAISAGACDDVGQFIASDRSATLRQHASAAPGN